MTRLSCYLALLAFALVVVLIMSRSGSGDTLEEYAGTPPEGRLEKKEEEWRSQLTPEQFRVARKKGTEKAFSGEYADSKADGIYTCVCCGQPLFDSQAKFESGTGWPSFWQPIDKELLCLEDDSSWLSKRTEVMCSRCDAHLGHVFKDGPQPTGLRYCINSVSLKFKER